MTRLSLIKGAMRHAVRPWMGFVALGRSVRVLVFLCLVALLSGPLSTTGRAAEGSRRFRIGLSRRVSGDVKQNDAKAAFRAWARMILAEQFVTDDTDAVILNSANDLHAAVGSRDFDGIATLTTEFLELGIETESLYLTVRNGKVSEKYVLVVPSESPVQGPADLLGKEVLMPTSPRMEIAGSWLSLMIHDAVGTSVPGKVSLALVPTASKAVLQVFFRQAVASLVTAPSLALAEELNPQVAKKVRVVAQSPEIVAGVFFLTGNVSPALRASVDRTITTLHETPTGRQVLTVFQADRMERRGSGELAATRAFVNRASQVASRVREKKEGGNEP